MTLHFIKAFPDHDAFSPLETGTFTTESTRAVSIRCLDSRGWAYHEAEIKSGMPHDVVVRGTCGIHRLEVLDAEGHCLEKIEYDLRAKTGLEAEGTAFEKLAQLMDEEHNLKGSPYCNTYEFGGKRYKILVTWSRDHAYSLNLSRHYLEDVQSGMELWLDTQREDGRFWDCLHPNPDGSPTWFGEALGEGNFTYFDDGHIIARRIPVEADVEYCVAEGVYYAFKATGDLAWLRRQMPRLEKALEFNTSDPIHWSQSKQLVRRSFCMDSWDFVNPLFCSGDHRCYHEDDAQFLLHCDNSGLYAFYWRMAEFYEALGQPEQAKEMLKAGEALRERANRELFFETNYGHMIPESEDPEKIYAMVGDERKRMSVSTGYTLVRGMATHEMAVATLDEYRRRYVEKRDESFAEWWTMDPPYEFDQWPAKSSGQGPAKGEYMNGAICHIASGALSKAAFEHGREDYGVDILQRVWELSERDGGHMHEAYKRLPHPNPESDKVQYQALNLSSVCNRGVENGATPGVKSWTDEGDNDLRELPVGSQTFGRIPFTVIDPKKNGGKSVTVLRYGVEDCSPETTIEVGGQKAKSFYLLHALGGGQKKGSVVATVTMEYTDGSSFPHFIKAGFEISSWWGIESRGTRGPVVDEKCTRVAWRGANPTWKNVGLYMTGLENPHPDKAIAKLKVELSPESVLKSAAYLLAGVTLSDQGVAFEENIRSHGLPACWANAAVFEALYEGLGGVKDLGTRYSKALVAPRWTEAGVKNAQTTLHYPATDGYCTSRYSWDQVAGQLRLDLSGSFERLDFHVLLPAGKTVENVSCGCQKLAWTVLNVEASSYVDFVMSEAPKAAVVIQLKG